MIKGNVNNLEEFATHIEKLMNSEEVHSQNIIIFGKKIGTGEEDDHFQLGLTSVKLLKRVQEFDNKGVYHIDATYKIIKQNFPVIVFGFTDLARQFYPVAFMITSHEKTSNYNHFFIQLLKEFLNINIVFQPQFMVIDACRAMANTIKQIFPACKILMCWFHLKQNIRKHKTKIPEHLYTKTMKQVNSLHCSTDLNSYKVKTTI